VYLRGTGHGQISPVTVTVPLTDAYILVLLSHIRLEHKVIYSLQVSSQNPAWTFTRHHLLFIRGPRGSDVTLLEN